VLKHPIICLVVSFFVRVFDVLCGLLGLRTPTRCVVLFYHSVRPEERRRFAEQMDVLVRHTTPIRGDIGQLPKERGHYVAVTFDDGLECVYDNALPELRKRGIPATIFIVTGTLGRGADWKDMGAADAVGQRVMSLEQLQQLAPDLVAIGSHSVNHPFLPSLGKEQLREELLSSRLMLELILKRDVRLFSCPYGGFDSNVIESCREAGYERVFTALPVLAFMQPREFVTGRVRATASDWPLEFRLKLAGAYRWLPAAIACKRALISMFSNVVDEGSGARVRGSSPRDPETIGERLHLK
jgi:peptidoglycan/xylan/chitin deacetylase (PgdA/CDA1 family)